MAKLEYMIHANEGATKESAPFTGTFVNKETKQISDACEDIGKLCGCPKALVKSVIFGAFDAFMDAEKEAITRFHVDGGVIRGKITGSFPTADAEFDSSRNALELDFSLDDDIRLALVNETPRLVTDETVTKIKVNLVSDYENERPYNVVYSNHKFHIQGSRMVMSDEGAGIYALDSLGIKHALTLVQAVSTQDLIAKFTSVPTLGDYKICVQSRAGDAEGPLQVSFRKVKVVYAEPDPIAKTTDGKCYITTLKDATTQSTTDFNLDNGIVGEGGGWYELSEASADQWSCEEVGTTLGGTYYSLNFTISSDHKKVTVGEGSTEIPAGTYENVVLTYNFSHGSAGTGSDQFTVTLPKLIVA